MDGESSLRPMRDPARIPRVSGVTEQMSWWRWARLRQLNPMIPDSLLAGVLAVIGVSIHERVREIGLLRAVG